jgi:two-component system sensor histidine kinase YesM
MHNRERKTPVALRAILYLIFATSIILPVAIFILVIPSYYRTTMTKETIQETNAKMEIVSERILSYLSDIQQVTVLAYSDPTILALLSDNTAPKVINLSQTAISHTANTILDKKILSVILLGINGNIGYYHRNQNVALKPDCDFTPLKNQAENGRKYMGAHHPFYFDLTDSSTVFSMIRPIQHPYSAIKQGTILIDADSSLFEEAFHILSTQKDAVSILMDDEGQILYSSQSIPSFALAELKERKKTIAFSNTSYQTLYRNVPIEGWSIAVLTSSDQINKSISLLYLVGFITAAISILLTYLIFRYLSTRLLLVPLKEMALVMKEVEKGNLEVSFHTKYHNEISALGLTMNRMIDQLKLLIDQEYKMAISQKQAEFRALQARIKPHFLYNTLNCLIGLNRLGDRQKLEEAILDLTDMMRYSLSDSEKGMSTVGAEIEFIRQYVHLEKMRFEEKLNFFLELDPLAKDIVIPKMLFQPLVENSIIHNIESSTKPITVRVLVRLVPQENCLSIIVEDEGKGFDLTDDSKREGIGLSNVKERILKGKQGSMITVKSEIGVGTSIEISIPLEEENIDAN